jgi:hypothetical protein
VSTAADTPGRAGSRRAVALTGVTIGTALLVTAYWQGWRPRIPALPPALGAPTGAPAGWLLFVGTVTAELLRRHHKALAAGAARQASRGTVAAARAAGTGTRSLARWLEAKAAPRWHARQHVPVLLARPRPAATADDGGAAERAARREAERRQRLATGTPAAVVTPATVTPAPAGMGSPGAAAPEGDRPMTTPPTPPPAPSATNRGNTPAGWRALVAATAGFEPDDDAALLEWMAAEVAGMSAYAEALAEVYETCVNSLGIDPAAMNAVHDTADAAADAATAMAYARQKFAAHYAEVREFAAAGGLLPYDGRWITGDGDA